MIMNYNKDYYKENILVSKNTNFARKNITWMTKSIKAQQERPFRIPGLRYVIEYLDYSYTTLVMQDKI